MVTVSERSDRCVTSPQVVARQRPDPPMFRSRPRARRERRRAGTYLWRIPGCQGGVSSLSLRGFVRRSRGQGPAAGRRASDRVASLDAGEDGRTIGRPGRRHWLVMATSVVGAAFVVYLEMVGVPQAPRLTLVRGPAMGPVTRGLMGCPAGKVRGARVRPLDLLKVVQLAAGERCQSGSGPHRPVASSVAGWFADTVTIAAGSAQPTAGSSTQAWSPRARSRWWQRRTSLRATASRARPAPARRASRV
jgi:hypothetical protein